MTLQAPAKRHYRKDPGLPDYDVSMPLDTDYYAVFDGVPEDDRVLWKRARSFVDEVLPVINAHWDAAEYPIHLVARMGELELLTDGVTVPGFPQMSPLGAGLVSMEISRGDGSLGAALSVQGGLGLRSIAMFGSKEQKRTWLGPVARGEALTAFALTEPDHGSDSVGLETSAVQDGDDYLLNGEKKWIGNGSVGDLTIVWARTDDGDVKGFLVPQNTPGYTAEIITGKASLRAIHQSRIRLENVRIPAQNLLPGAKNFKDVSKVLAATRAGVAWSALGHATAVYEAAVNYAGQRVQFGRKLAGFQLIQERLTVMLSELTSMQLHCMQLATLEAAGMLRPAQASMAKYHNTRKARKLASIARDLLGGNGILLENHVARHMADIEAIHTYEGTESIQALIIGRDITGKSAFT